MSTPHYDVVIVGGGIVGLATAMALSSRVPAAKLLILEKEPQLAAHQSGHNSGVIHSGLYYRPGSVKAATCVAGAARLVEFCEANGIPFRICGKVVVATEPAELPVLETLYQRGVANGVRGVALIGPERLRELEPHARGLKALHVPSAGVVDFARVARTFAEIVQRRGGTIRTSTRLLRLLRRQGTWHVETTAGTIRAAYVVTCGGLHADRLATAAGHSTVAKPESSDAERSEARRSDLRIVPFRGEYYDVVPERQDLVNTMIYPVPDPALPFLGAHLTRTIAGNVHAGPNAVLAFKREGYRKTDVDLRDLSAMLGYGGFWRMAFRYGATGLGELYRSLNKRAFVRALQRLVPELQPDDLMPGGSGVRAQAVDAQGSLLDDFNIVQVKGAVHVRNVPSPAATASIRIGEMIADQVAGCQTPVLLTARRKRSKIYR